MNKLADLIEKRKSAFDRMKAAQGGDAETFTTAETEVRDLDESIRRVKAVDAADRSDIGTPLSGSNDEKLSRELRNFSIAKMIAHKAGMDVDAGLEIEMQAELAKRAGGPAKGFYAPTEIFETRVQTTATSAAILPTDFRPDLFTSALTASAVVTTLGATVLTGLTGNVEIPREVGSPAVAWVNENEALSYGDATFDTLTLSPHHVGAISEISRNMIMQASPDVEQLLRNMLARNIALEIDRAAVNGSGIGAVPLGILNDAAVPSEAYATDLFTTTANMIAKADLANVSPTRGFLSTNGVKATAAKTRDADQHPLGIDTIFHGEPVQFSNQVPNNLNPTLNKHGLIYGDWRDFIIGIWSQLDILVNPYAEGAYSKGNLLIRAMATVDFGVRRPASFVKATGVVVG